MDNIITPKRNREIKQIIEGTIRLNYRNPNFCITNLCSILHISKSYLCELIYFNFGMSPYHLLETIKMENAILLFRKDYKIRHIAKHIGYMSTQTFRRACKRRLGMTPIMLKNKIFTQPDGDKIIKECVKLLWNVG